MKQRFKVDDNRVICASWEDDKDWTKIYSETKSKKIMDQVYEIPISKDNESLPRCLIVVVPKKRGIMNICKT